MVGDSVGNPVGELGGASVENLVGDSVGDAVGEPVGESDGDPEGTNMYGGGSGREGTEKLCGECYTARDVRGFDGMWMGEGGMRSWGGWIAFMGDHLLTEILLEISLVTRSATRSAIQWATLKVLNMGNIEG